MFSKTLVGMFLGDARRHTLVHTLLRSLNVRGLDPVVTLVTTCSLTTCCGEKTRNTLRDEFDRHNRRGCSLDLFSFELFSIDCMILSKEV